MESVEVIDIILIFNSPNLKKYFSQFPFNWILIGSLQQTAWNISFQIKADFLKLQEYLSFYSNKILLLFSRYAELFECNIFYFMSKMISKTITGQNKFQFLETIMQVGVMNV